MKPCRSRWGRKTISWEEKWTPCIKICTSWRTRTKSSGNSSKPLIQRIRNIWWSRNFRTSYKIWISITWRSDRRRNLLLLPISDFSGGSRSKGSRATAQGPLLWRTSHPSEMCLHPTIWLTTTSLGEEQEEVYWSTNNTTATLRGMQCEALFKILGIMGCHRIGKWHSSLWVISTWSPHCSKPWSKKTKRSTFTRTNLAQKVVTCKWGIP